MDPDPYLSVVTDSSGIIFHPITLETIVCIVILLLLLAVSAFISGSEAAYFSLSANDLKNLGSKKNLHNKRINNLLLKPEILLATTVIANCFVNISVVVLFAYTAHSLVEFVHSPAWGMVLQITIAAFLLLIFGEMIPRIYAAQNALKVAYRTSGLLSIFEKIFYPLAKLFVSSTSYVRRRVQKNQSISIDTLSDALERDSNAIVENKDILQGIVKFGNIDARTIMTARINVEAVDVDTKLPELIALINECGYSRLPVYDDSPDNIKGILYVKDLLPFINESRVFRWQSLIRNAYFVPENKKIDDLLKEFQEKKIHMAVIIDEYGGMAGIVTLEDILEEIMGDIADESDDDEPDYEKIDDHTYLFDGTVLLNDFYRALHVEDTIFDDIKGEADTLAGIILELKGEMPQKGDCVDYQNMSFCVEEMDNRRIKRIKVIVNEFKQE